MLSKVRAIPDDPHRKSNTTILSIARHGDAATVVQQFQMTTIKSQAGSPDQAVELVANSTDMWILVKGVWLLKRTVTNEIQYKVDGREVVHKLHTPHSAASGA